MNCNKYSLQQSKQPITQLKMETPAWGYSMEVPENCLQVSPYVDGAAWSLSITGRIHYYYEPTATWLEVCPSHSHSLLFPLISNYHYSFSLPLLLLDPWSLTSLH